MPSNSHRQYWRANLKYLAVLLAVWFVAGFLLPILLVDLLNTVRIGGIPFGFWSLMQGANLVFVILLFVYVRLMNRLDREHDLE